MALPILTLTTSNVVLKSFRAFLVVLLEKVSSSNFWGSRLQARLMWKKSEQSGIDEDFVGVLASSSACDSSFFRFLDATSRFSSPLDTYSLGWRIEDAALLHASRSLLSSLWTGLAVLSERNQRV
jgi:hypothetical protein